MTTEGPKEADREKAAELLRGGYRQEAIAAALAAEREKARAPFLALLDEEPDIQPLWDFERGMLRALEMAKDAIRRALNAGQEEGRRFPNHVADPADNDLCPGSQTGPDARGRCSHCGMQHP